MLTAVVRTKGKAYFLPFIIERAYPFVDAIVLVENNKTPQWDQLQIKFPKIKYKHDPRELIPVYSDRQKELALSGNHSEYQSLASFYRDSFALADPGQVIKLDDDDFWTLEGWERILELSKTLGSKEIVYFNGINLINSNQVSLKTPICGGRDHFLIGDSISYDFLNAPQWEVLKINTTKYKRKYFGLTYYHLKFYNDFFDPTRDLDGSNNNHIKEEILNKIEPISPELIKIKLKNIWLDKYFPFLLPNSHLGISQFLDFFNRTESDRLSLLNFHKYGKDTF